MSTKKLFCMFYSNFFEFLILQLLIHFYLEIPWSHLQLKTIFGIFGKQRHELFPLVHDLFVDLVVADALLKFGLFMYIYRHFNHFKNEAKVNRFFATCYCKY